MKKYTNAAIITVLSLILVFIAGPRIGRAYLYWRVMSHTDGMIKAASEWADIYYSGPDKEYIPLIKRMTDYYLPLILRDFKIRDPKRAVIVVYSDAGRFRAAVGKRLDALPMGAYYGGVINIISPSLWMANAQDAYAKDYFIQYGPLIHEFAHYAEDMSSGGRRPPQWLAEGVALYYEYKYTGVEWRPDLESEASKITPDELRKNFSGLDERVAYRKAFDVVRDYVGKYGEDGLRD